MGRENLKFSLPIHRHLGTDSDRNGRYQENRAEPVDEKSVEASGDMV